MAHRRERIEMEVASLRKRQDNVNYARADGDASIPFYTVRTPGGCVWAADGVTASRQSGRGFAKDQMAVLLAPAFFDRPTYEFLEELLAPSHPRGSRLFLERVERNYHGEQFGKLWEDMLTNRHVIVVGLYRCPEAVSRNVPERLAPASYVLTGPARDTLIHAGDCMYVLETRFQQGVRRIPGLADVFRYACCSLIVPATSMLSEKRVQADRGDHAFAKRRCKAVTAACSSVWHPAAPGRANNGCVVARADSWSWRRHREWFRRRCNWRQRWWWRRRRQQQQQRRSTSRDASAGDGSARACGR